MDGELLRDFAARYIWWKTPDAAIRFPNRVLAQVMELGTFDDLQVLLKKFPKADLAAVLQRAEAGWFTSRSWHFWHYRLGLSALDKVPPLPQKVIP